MNSSKLLVVDRINEEFDKFYFLWISWCYATLDPDFDGEPVKFMSRRMKSIKSHIEEETINPSEIKEENPQEEIIFDPTEKEDEKRKKVVIAEGVEFNVATKMIHYIDPKTGKLIAENLTDYSRKQILGTMPTLDEFLAKWSETERKDAIVKELENKGIPLEELQKEVGLNVDVFDLILHVAYNKKPFTRSERVAALRKEDYFAKYEGRARQVIEALLDKYADQGSAIDNIGDLDVAIYRDWYAC